MGKGSDTFTIEQICEATSGCLECGVGSSEVIGVVTDSRDVKPGCLFVALKGDRFDGSAFCLDAIKAGAKAVLVERTSRDKGLCVHEGEYGVIRVDDTLRALGDLAAWHRNQYDARLIGVTGSNGKTSTKEMIAAVLGGEPHVLANRGNFNNLIGMPRALLRLGPLHDWAVMEMGMNAPGEIARLAQVARPQLGVVTNVHPVHMEGLGSIQAIAAAKGELIESLPADGVAVLNADDPYVLQQAKRSRARVFTFGQSPTADVRVAQAMQGLNGIDFFLFMDGRRVAVQMPRMGIHNATNAAAAAAVGLVEGIAPDLIVQGLKRASVPSMRMELVELGRTRVIVDCYNANPRSVQAALSTMSKLPADGTRLAILGDMLELGSASKQLHAHVGRLAASSGLKGLCAFGQQSVHMVDAARDAGLSDVFHAQRIEDAIGWARERIEECAWLLLKGSRGMQMERVLDGLVEQLSQVQAKERG